VRRISFKLSVISYIAYTPSMPVNGKITVDSYISEAFFEKEKEEIWKKQWLLAGRESDLREPGDYFVFDIQVIGASILVVKGSDKKIRAFHNICRHRGSKLCPDACGRAARFVCKSHGWVYDVTGKLFNVPWEDQFEHIDRDDAALAMVKLDTWGGLVFVNLNPDPVEPLASYLRGFPAPLERYLAESNWVWQMGHKYVCGHNWKLGIEGTVEAYHANTTHAETIFGRFAVEDQEITIFPDGGGVQSRLTLFQPEVLQRSTESFRKAGVDVASLHSDKSADAKALATSAASFVEKLAIKHSTRTVGMFLDKALADRDSSQAAQDYDGAINLSQAPNWMFDGYTVLPNTFLLFSKNKMSVFQYWPLDVDSCVFDLDVFYIDEADNFGGLFARMQRGVMESDIQPQDIYAWECMQENFKAGYIKDNYLSAPEDAVRCFHDSIPGMVDRD